MKYTIDTQMRSNMLDAINDTPMQVYKDRAKAFIEARCNTIISDVAENINKALLAKPPQIEDAHELLSVINGVNAALDYANKTITLAETLLEILDVWACSKLDIIVPDNTDDHKYLVNVLFGPFG